MIIELKDRLEKAATKVPPLWQGSKHEAWYRNNNYSKGAHGSYCYKIFLESEGCEVEIISDEGDIRYRTPGAKKWIKAEVKASKADLKPLQRTPGFVTEHLWFNQLRPNQKGWDEAVLVGCYPNHIRIWRKSRADWDKECATLVSTNKVLNHIGTDELRGVDLLKNSKSDNFHEWECIHNDQQGELL
jgi:hypothetical protein